MDEAIAASVADVRNRELSSLARRARSTDGGTAIARRWVERHPDRIRYSEHAGHQNWA
jgi:hypothetical protein